MQATAVPQQITATKQAVSRLPSLTGMRFLAALSVFFIHSLMLADPLKVTVPMSFFADPDIAQTLATLVGKIGYAGVSFFFVLSGFVLTWSYRPGTRTKAFIRRRMVKIFPNHLVMWVLAMVLYASAFTPVSTWLSNLLLVHAYSPKAEVFTSVNPPCWTLCCELLFYVLFPILFIKPVLKVPAKRLWAWAWGMVGTMVVLELITTFVVPDEPRSAMLPIAIPQQWFGYIFPPARLPEFILGMFLARIVAAGLWPRIGLGPAGLLAGAGYLWTFWVPSPFDFTVSMILPIIVLIGAAASADVAGRRTFLNSRLMVWLGNISFGFYICQGVVLFHGRVWLVGDGTYSTPVAFALWIGYFLLTLAAGAALYHLVEDPMMRHFSSSRKRPRTPAGPTPPSRASLGLRSAAELDALPSRSATPVGSTRRVSVG